AFDNRDATRPVTDGSRTRPLRELGHGPEHACSTGLAAHHRQAALDRVLACRCQQLIDETLHRKARMGVTDGPPRHRRHAHLRLMQVTAEIGNVVEKFARAFDHDGVDAILDDKTFKWRAFEKRLSDDRARPGGDLALAHRTAHAMDEQRPIIAAAYVVLPCLDELDAMSRPDCLCHAGKLNGKMLIDRTTSPEAAAAEQGLEFDLLRGKPKDAGDRLMIGRLDLAAEPRACLLAVELQKAVHRLHR